MTDAAPCTERHHPAADDGLVGPLATDMTAWRSRGRPGSGLTAHHWTSLRNWNDGSLRRPRVVHVHDPGGAYPLGMDHAPGIQRGRRHGRPGTGARTTVRPTRRARLHA